MKPKLAAGKKIPTLFGLSTPSNTTCYSSRTRFLSLCSRNCSGSLLIGSRVIVPLSFPSTITSFSTLGNIVSPDENPISSSGSATASTSCGWPSDSTVLRISLDDHMKSSEEDGDLTSNAQRYYHILHKLHEYCRPQPEQAKEKGLVEIMPCASELDHAAVKFEPIPGRDLFKTEFSDPKGPFWWCQTARFKIPVLEIYDNTELFLRNLIAFEQCCPKGSQHFTSYALLMDMLVNSGRDIQLLERAGVMRNYLGARADATNLFNNLCKGVVLGEFFFADMCNRATAYSKRRWPKNLAHIRRTYLSSPWSFIAFCVAFIAFSIQVVTFVLEFPFINEDNHEYLQCSTSH
ncbi:hypothetical protein RHMOL_Rhmol05G0295100 [Rhododendron molle]|uniref:Uncharacterized protein n=1 Tax=Rhododendron molle TaxID=49168 RepID=A0ACC0NUI6_RHOML|nr:hypothetical protein RHMOL_Rhmol05G0295100 [Rhododendron molle]